MKQLRISKQITNREDLSLDRYLHDISQFALISVEEETTLAAQIREGDTLALEKLTKANLRFVVSVAKQYQNFGLKLQDLINEGNIGLVRAAYKFDETRGFKFISYAVWWIRQAMLQALAEHARIVRLPLNKINAINKINKASAYLEQTLQRPPSTDEISEMVAISRTEIDQCIRNSGWHVSVDKSMRAGEDICLADLLKATGTPDPDHALLCNSLKTDLEMILKILSPKEIEILKLYYGIDSFNATSLEEIGSIMNLTKERVRQIKEVALRRLKKSGSEVLLDYLG